ncbi:MAG: peptidoglycan-binding protein [Actinomycetota bacterium]|nr:peptidoglycan-binding protein [Actinomycetota bacterium]
MKFEIIDNCPVPAQLAPAIRAIKARTGATLNSCDRSGDAEPYLRKLGKSSQRQLYAGWVARKPGFNPANPPGRSTHERRNDGAAYPGPAGAPLRYWQVGMDWSNAQGVVREAAGLGFTASVTYPGNPREGHHVNFRREPRVIKPFKVVKRGAKGPRVRQITRRLAIARDPHDKKPYLGNPKREFDAEVEEALKRFQRDHHQAADGIYGRQTARQLAHSARYWKQRLRERKS